ncbi:citrate lyase beta chain [Arthrobacter sp. Soil736]|uniref:HpcH/HpaI aldolase/citrate lyase family protein n=1 Tax=Arthrobacter sp. Soil736 TaxID=1736395 RepID=UPI0006FDE272|nr:CoA ester lyase [Arthrobacter sp. Soil736]KRE64234.1 citrate lyase beta chain [Arthrobacter sp. Soil736]
MTAPETLSATTTGEGIVSEAVTALFVPGDRPERFAKATASGADVVIIDLEDAVAPADKAAALASAVDALARGGVRALVRVNPIDSPAYDAEITALLSLTEWQHHGLLGIIVPKADDPEVLLRLRNRLPADLALVPLIESAAGLIHALELAQVRGITRLAFGAIDFALDINADSGDRYLDHARSELVLASRAAGIAAPLDSPCTEIRDAGRISESARLARNFGFSGKLCIHPAQIPFVGAAFAPAEEEVAWALSVIDAEGGATQVAGQMIDRPVTERAKRILHQAKKGSSNG